MPRGIKSQEELTPERAALRARQLVAEQKWRETHKEYSKLKYMVSRYGLTVEKYQQMVLDQGGVCKICSQPPCDRWNRLHVDHCHKTGKVRALLCHKCNTAIGNLRDDIALLYKAIAYLEEYKE